MRHREGWPRTGREGNCSAGILPKATSLVNQFLDHPGRISRGTPRGGPERDPWEVVQGNETVTFRMHPSVGLVDRCVGGAGGRENHPRLVLQGVVQTRLRHETSDAHQRDHGTFPSRAYREDRFTGPMIAAERAMILARAGEAEAALDEINRLLANPSSVTVHTLRLDPRWDPIRTHPRFKALLVKYANPERPAG